METRIDPLQGTGILPGIARSLADKAIAYCGLVKPELPFSAGICVIVGQVIASGALPPALNMALGFLASFFISGAAMISNDCFDVEVDRVSHPERPLPSGRATIPEAVALTGLFSIAGIVSAGLLGLPALCLALAMLAVGLLYNWRLKESGLPGHMLVAASVASTFVLGGVTAGDWNNGLVWAFGAIAFLFDLGEEIANSAMDMEGDGKRSARTFARAYGRENALRAATIILLSIVALSASLFAMGLLGIAYLGVFVPMGIALAYLALKLPSIGNIGDGRAKTRQLYLMMTLFILAFVLMRIAIYYLPVGSYIYLSDILGMVTYLPVGSLFWPG